MSQRRGWVTGLATLAGSLAFLLPAALQAPNQSAPQDQLVWTARATFVEERKEDWPGNYTLFSTKRVSATYRLVVPRTGGQATWEAASVDYSETGVQTGVKIQLGGTDYEWQARKSLALPSEKQQMEEMLRAAQAGQPQPTGVSLPVFILYRIGARSYLLPALSLGVEALHPGARIRREYPSGRETREDLRVIIHSKLPKETPAAPAAPPQPPKSQAEAMKWALEQGRSIMEGAPPIPGLIELKGKVIADSRQWTEPLGHEGEETGPTGGAVGEVRYSFSWEFRLAPENVEAVLIPEDRYQRWWPKAGDDEEAPGNKLDVMVVLQKKGQPGKVPLQTAQFKFELLDVSREPGVCLNWPPKEKAKNTFDLRIEPAANPQLRNFHEDRLTAESRPGLQEARVTITSHDWGAYGHLLVTATLDDGSSVVAHLENQPDKTELVIPRDDNDNHIADDWEDFIGVPGSKKPDADEDSIPAGDGTPGDGLSLYEEYRGFYSQGEHLRTDPDIKDIFIHDQHKLGLGDYGQSELLAHLIRFKELNTENAAGAQSLWVINFNHDFAHRGTQHALWLKNANLPGLFGIAEGKGPGAPKLTFVVKVDKARCLKVSAAELHSTIAHELSHASGVWHHGDKDYRITSLGERKPDGTWRSVPFPSGVRDYGVAAQGGQHSGVEDCIMRYEGNSYYEAPGGHYRWTKPGGGVVEGEEYPPAEVPGTVFCNKKEGTGVNDPAGGQTPDGRKLPKAGNASCGDCQHQFCVNDVVECKRAAEKAACGRP